MDVEVDVLPPFPHVRGSCVTFPQNCDACQSSLSLTPTSKMRIQVVVIGRDMVDAILHKKSNLSPSSAAPI